MRIVLVHAAAMMSTFDVGNGYRDGLVANGHQILEYRLYARIQYHAAAMRKTMPKAHQNQMLLVWLASEGVVAAAAQFNADWVVIISGLGFDPRAITPLKRLGIPVAVLFTESPYDDADQLEFAQFVDLAFTTERVSADRHGWHYLAHAVNPETHTPEGPSHPDGPFDVVMVGTGWGERQRLLEGVDWTGINLRLAGPWPGLRRKSPLFPHWRKGIVENAETIQYYRSARICLNIHRASTEAQSLGPRAREIAACGAFQLSDRRDELLDVFGDSVPTFTTSADLEKQVRFFLAHKTERAELATRQRACVGTDTFANRAAEMVAILEAHHSRRLTPVAI